MAGDDHWWSILPKLNVTDNFLALSRYTCLFLLSFILLSYVSILLLWYNVPHHELSMKPWVINLRKECVSPQPPTSTSPSTSTSMITPSLITQAASFPQSEVLKFIIDHARGGIDMQTRDGWSALHFACYFNHYENVLLLCNHGANVNLKTNSGQTALHISTSSMLTNIARGLIVFGADVNMKDKVGDTPLHRAASLGNVVSCELLVDFGAEVDPENNLKQTPLIRAVRSRKKEAAVYLIRKGANWDSLIKPDQKNETHFDRFRIPKDFLISINEAVQMMDVEDRLHKPL